MSDFDPRSPKDPARRAARTPAQRVDVPARSIGAGSERSAAAAPATGGLVDTQGRTVRDLRISVTDRCNLRCVYCMPAEGMPWLPKDDLLTYEEITRFARICIGLGVEGVRLTGGEPTVRADLPHLVEMLNGLAPDLDLSLTTNALKLEAMAEPLRDAGLKRVNVSLDTLDPKRFHQLARRDRFHEVLAGLEASKRVGFTPIKINAVLMRGFNEDEAVPLARWGRENGFEVRFIEWMPLDFQHTWSREQLVPADEILAQIDAAFPIEIAKDTDPSAPARRYLYRDGVGSVGVIASVTRPFCGHCDRVRLTADGQIRTCLFSHREYDFRKAMRGGASDAEVADLLRAAVWRKEPGHLINSPFFVQPERGMSAIGG
jgi:GTP 3',8-cyclase